MSEEKDVPEAEQVPLTGYADRLSVRGGEPIGFRICTTSPGERIGARLYRSICADPNPDGPGLIEQPCDEWFEPRRFTGRHQPIHTGSAGVCDHPLDLDTTTLVIFELLAFPTLRCITEQCLMSLGPLRLYLDPAGRPACRYADAVATLPEPVPLHRWARIRLTLDRGADGAPGALRLCTMSPDGVDAHASTTTPLDGGGIVDPDPSTDASTTASTDGRPGALVGTLCVAARQDGSGTQLTDHFNGKLEAPSIRAGTSCDALTLRLHWDFSKETPTTRLVDVGPAGRHGHLINLPARAMTGAAWDGSETCWRHAPEHYGAIHFHDDDLVDAGWSDDLVFDVPSGLPSGIYLMRLSQGAHEDAIPFWVCAPRGAPTASLCVLVSTFTYAVYGNHARPDWRPDWQERVREWNAWPYNPARYPGYGLSTYNDHTDGSGICHASHRRPLLNLRPGYLTFSEPGHEGSGLRHFQADSHLIAWLHAKGIEHDIITDRELHEEGAACLTPYRAVTTGTHPEYHTRETLDALTGYRDGGGNLLYLGGNGFYWRIALHAEDPAAIEIRRAEDGIRAWAAEPGEYWQAFDGAYGGLWRRNGRAPQALVGIGFSAQGRMNGSHYRRVTRDPSLDWVFAGIDSDLIGTTGLCGGGAAGFELDRADHRLGTPEGTVVLAASEQHGDDFVLVPEEMLTHLTTVPGRPAAELLHADMTWYETPAGGAVFSVGSITFCGSLPCNDFDNDVSQLLANVLDRMLAGTS